MLSGRLQKMKSDNIRGTFIARMNMSASFSRYASFKARSIFHPIAFDIM
jgi:hypothetical protein